MRLLVYGNPVYANAAALTTALNGLHASTPATAILDHSGNQASVLSRQWAQNNGVAWHSFDAQLTEEGYMDPNARALRFHQLANVDTVAVFGSGADVEKVAAVSLAAKKITANRF